MKFTQALVRKYIYTQLYNTSRKHTYIILTPLNPTFV